MFFLITLLLFSSPSPASDPSGIKFDRSTIKMTIELDIEEIRKMNETLSSMGAYSSRMVLQKKHSLSPFSKSITCKRGLDHTDSYCEVTALYNLASGISFERSFNLLQTEISQLLERTPNVGMSNFTVELQNQIFNCFYGNAGVGFPKQYCLVEQKN